MMFLRYRNGNYIVTRDNPASSMKKRCFRVGEDFEPEFPDSIDLKISGRCSTGCSYCHEDSKADGKLANYEDLVSHLSVLPREASIEIAIGGGNILEDKESRNLFCRLARYLYDQGKPIAVTINENEFTEENVRFLKNIPAVEYSEVDEDTKMAAIPINIGVSLGPGITRTRLLEILTLYVNYFDCWSNCSCVFHIILGMFPLDLLKDLLYQELETRPFNTMRVLFLGFKQFGRAQNTSLPKEISNFENIIKEYILKSDIKLKEETDPYTKTRHTVIGFDNLAIEQLKFEKAMTKPTFESVYMGNEFSCSMYIDGVEGKYAKSSTDPKENRVDWNSCDIIKYFNHDKSKK